MRLCITGILLFLLAATAWGAQEEPTISNGVPVWPQYYNGTNFRNPRIDPSTRATSTIEYEHHEVHTGNHYFTKNIATVASGATIAYLMAVPNSAKAPHLTWSGTGSAITDVVLIEGVPSTLNGNAQTIFNNDRNSANVSGCTFYDTVTGGPWTGTTIYRIKSGSATQQSRTPATHTRDAELILKSGTTYAFLFTSGTNDNLTNLVCEWYEHTPKDN